MTAFGQSDGPTGGFSASTAGTRPSAAGVLALIGIVVLATSVYLLTTYGRGHGVDGARYYYTADAFLRGRLNIDENAAAVGARRGDDGHFYMQYGPGQSIAEVPWIAALRAVLHARDVSVPDRLALMRAWGPILTNTFLAAATIAVMYLLVIQLGYRARTAAVMALLVAFTTPLWNYARLDFSEPLQCFLILAAYWRIVCARPSAFLASALGAGLAIGGLVLTKAVFVLVAPIAWLALLWRVRPWEFGRITRVTLAFGAPVAISGVIYLAWNFARFGAAFDFGYNESFDTPLLAGLYGLFFSSGKSVFLYAPVILAALFAIPHFARRHRAELVVIFALSAPVVCVYAAFWAWHGDWSWGPRYMLPFMALWMLPVATVVDSGGRVWRGAIAALALLGVYVQVLGVAINAGTYLNLHATQVAPKAHDGQKLVIEQAQIDVHFVPEFSPLAGHWWLLKAVVEKWRDPGKSIEQFDALRDTPWFRPGREQWRPEHLEQALILDLWLADPPREMGPDAVRRIALPLLVLAVLGLLMTVTGMLALTRRNIA